MWWPRTVGGWCTRLSLTLLWQLEEAAAALASERAAHAETKRERDEAFQKYVDANEARIDAEAKMAKAREALTLIDALDPEGHSAGCSADALRGLVSRMGEIARTALKELGD